MFTFVVHFVVLVGESKLMFPVHIDELHPGKCGTDHSDYTTR